MPCPVGGYSTPDVPADTLYILASVPPPVTRQKNSQGLTLVLCRDTIQGMNQTIYFQRDVWAKLQAEEKKSALINSLLRKHYDVIEPLSKPSVTTQHKPAIPQPAEAPRVSADPYDTSMFDRGDVSPITKSHSARKKGAKWPTTNIKPDTTPVGPVASASPGNAGAMQESEPSSDTEEPTDEFKIPDEFDTDSLRAVKEKAAAAVRQSLARTDVTPIDKKYSARKRK